MSKFVAGDKAPIFEGVNQKGKKISLNDFKGKKLILYFYPKDDTPGCTAESCNLNDNYEMWLKKGFEIIGVSPDNEKSHLKFIDKYGLKFNLIADTNPRNVRCMGRKKHVWEKIYGCAAHNLCNR